MFVWQTFLSEEVLVVGDEQESPRAPMNLGISGVTPKSTLLPALTDLPEADQASEALSNRGLNIVVE